MRILILTGSSAPETGGIAALVQGYAEGLAGQGIEVRMLSATPGASRFSTERLPITEFELPDRGYFTRVAACRKAVEAELKNAPCDRILTSSWSPFAVDLPASLGGITIPKDILCHGMDLLEPSRSLRYRMLLYHILRSAALLVANSQFTGRTAQRLGAPNERVVVIPPGVDPARFQPAPRPAAILERYRIPASSPVLLSLGRLVPRKGFDLVLRALPQVLKDFPEAIYLVAGDGPDRHRLETFAAALGVKPQVRFTGAIEDQELPDIYHSADLFAMPSRYIEKEGDVEGFGIVFLEAGCCGLPVIGGNSGGIRDAVADGATGYLVDPENPQDCAEIIHRLLADRDLRKRLGAAGRQRALDHFQWPQITARYLQAISGTAPFRSLG